MLKSTSRTEPKDGRVLPFWAYHTEIYASAVIVWPIWDGLLKHLSVRIDRLLVALESEQKKETFRHDMSVHVNW